MQPNPIVLGMTVSDNAKTIPMGLSTSIQVSAKLQEKTASPSSSQQIVKADSGYDGLSSVTLDAVTFTTATATATGTARSLAFSASEPPLGFYVRRTTGSSPSGTAVALAVMGHGSSMMQTALGTSSRLFSASGGYSGYNYATKTFTVTLPNGAYFMGSYEITYIK